jgi:hypothetical protein
MAYAVQGRARRCARGPKKWAAKNTKDRSKCGQSTNLGAPISKIRCLTNSRTEYEQEDSTTYYYRGLGNVKNFHGASNLDR